MVGAAHHPGRSYNILLRRRPAAQQRHLSCLTAKRARYGRAPGDNMPSDAFLDDFDVYPVVAFALHHALQYHWKGGDLRGIGFSALDGQQLLVVLSFMDKEGLPDHLP